MLLLLSLAAVATSSAELVAILLQRVFPDILVKSDTMFLGGPPRRPDKATAYKQLREHLTILGVWVVVIRLTPYALHFLTKTSDLPEFTLPEA